MQTELSVLLLITASVMISCIVISYGVSIAQTTLSMTETPELDRIKAIQRAILNQTETLQNQTALIETNPTSP
jgi:hypothetical protein